MPLFPAIEVDVLDLVQSIAIIVVTSTLILKLHWLRLEIRSGTQTLTAILASNEALRLRVRDVEERMGEVEKRRGPKREVVAAS